MAQSDDSFGGFFLVLVVAGGFLAFSNYGWSNSLWYAAQYGVGFGDVQTDAKPNDCDFIHAPLGDKGCSYKAHVKVYNADGVLVAGENAPKYVERYQDSKAHHFLRRRQELGLAYWSNRL